MEDDVSCTPLARLGEQLSQVLRGEATVGEMQGTLDVPAGKVVVARVHHQCMASTLQGEELAPREIQTRVPSPAIPVRVRVDQGERRAHNLELWFCRSHGLRLWWLCVVVCARFASRAARSSASSLAGGRGSEGCWARKQAAAPNSQEPSVPRTGRK